ncbi:MAG: hypothetical protein FJW63_06295 [Actinobacteria bacterium]|nr:hypothetical protein [Actinomycetota bacterium]
MRKKRIIITIVVVICVLVGVFFVVRFGVVGRIYNFIQDKAFTDKEGNKIEILYQVPSDTEELKYETLHDKDGKEVVVEMRKILYINQYGNEVESWEETAEPIKIYDYMYKGKIEKVEDNKIYFTVDKKEKEGAEFVFEDVKDYQIIFDIDTYDLKDDLSVGYEVCDSLIFNYEHFYSADGLEFLLGEHLRVQDTMFEDYYIGEKYKVLVFYLH